MLRKIPVAPVQKIVAKSEWVSECYTACLIRDGEFRLWTPDLDRALDLIYKLLPAARYTSNAAHETTVIYHPDFGLHPCGFIVNCPVPLQFAHGEWEPRPLLTPLPRHRSACPVEHFTVTFTAWPKDGLDRILRSLSGDERLVLDLIVEGHSNKSIAKMLGINKFTIQKRVHDIALKSGISTRDPQIALVKKFCRLVPRVARNDQACRRWESWGNKNLRKQCLLGWMNARSTPQIAAAVDRKKETVLRCLSDMNEETQENDEPRRTRLQWAVSDRKLIVFSPKTQTKSSAQSLPNSMKKDVTERHPTALIKKCK
jgi:DNA-binding CsgD family transcriptional regulator